MSLPAVPVIVGEGQVSTFWSEYGASLSPDERSLYFTLTDAGFTRMTLLESARQGSGWGAPRVLPFSGVWSDGDAHVSRDGRRMVFISNRPQQGTAPRSDFDLWEVERAANGAWGTPRPLPRGINTDTTETYPAFGGDGSLYFGRNGRLYRAPPAAGGYGVQEMLPFAGPGIPRVGVRGRPHALPHQHPAPVGRHGTGRGATAGGLLGRGRGSTEERDERGRNIYRVDISALPER